MATDANTDTGVNASDFAEKRSRKTPGTPRTRRRTRGFSVSPASARQTVNP